MRKVSLVSSLCGCCLAVSANISHAVSITNGSLFVDISNTTGAIDQLTFGGSDWYNPGTPVSNWGIQSGADTASFGINVTSGGSGSSTIPVSSVTESGGTVSVQGSYTAASGDLISIQRSYSIVAGFDALLVTTNLTKSNPFASPGDIRLFETFDPDMGWDLNGDFRTYMDVENLGGFDVAEAWITNPMDLAVVMGTANALASGGPFQISSGGNLNNLFTSPVDANGAFVDEGMHLGFEGNLNAPSSSISFSYIQAYGTSLTDAQDEFLGAAGGPAVVPVPAAIWLFASGILGMVGIARRKQTA